MINLTSDFQLLADNYISSREKDKSLHIRTKDFRNEMINKCVYIWVYNEKRIIYVGTALSKGGALQRQKEHLKYLINGNEIFFDFSDYEMDPYQLFIRSKGKYQTDYDYLLEMANSKKIWINMDDKSGMHYYWDSMIKKEDSLIKNWNEKNIKYLKKISFYSIFLDDKNKAYELESYLQKYIINFITTMAKKTDGMFVKYYPENNYYNNSFFGRIHNTELDINNEYFKDKYRIYLDLLRLYFL